MWCSHCAAAALEVGIALIAKMFVACVTRAGPHASLLVTLVSQPCAYPPLTLSLAPSVYCETSHSSMPLKRFSSSSYSF